MKKLANFKKINIFFFIFNVILFLLIINPQIRHIFYNFIQSINISWIKKINSEGIKVFSSIVTSITATINILLVITFYRKNLRKDNEEKILTKKSYWFRDVILDSHIDDVRKFFTYLRELKGILENQDEEEYMQTFLHVKEKITILNGLFVQLLKVIDEELAESIEELLEEMEDGFVDLSVVALELKGSEFRDAINKISTFIDNEEIKMLKLLYSYEMANYDTKKVS
ncbi:hypothetical protein [Priestia sp. HNGD-A6]|uniref:hypothetical protein n=1 Tax=Priestia sp. HNGD-A6 TaxID=3092666 RepID=UPI003891A715